MPLQIDHNRAREIEELCSKSLEELEKAEQLVTKVIEVKGQSKGAVGSFEDKMIAEKKSQLRDVNKILINAIRNVKGLVNSIKKILGLGQALTSKAPGLGGSSQPPSEEDEDEASK
jgi:hypothetical protein